MPRYGRTIAPMANSQLTLLLVHAHPDDESISTGGVMARYAAEGARVVCVTCTGGEHGEIVVPEHGYAREPRPPGRDLRAEELRRALARLGNDRARARWATSTRE